MPSVARKPSGIESVLIKFRDEENDKETGWLDCSVGSVGWNYEVVWAGENASTEFKQVFAAENTKTVTAKAIDGAENETLDSKTFVYDRMRPVIFVTAPEETDGKADVSITITVTDTNPDKPQIIVKNSAGTEIPLTASDITITGPVGSDTTWVYTATLPFKDTISTDGLYTIEVTGKDKNGRSSVTDYKQIKRDGGAPELTIANPSADIEWGQALTDLAYTFKVHVDDGQGTGTSEISYAFSDTGTAPAEGHSAWTTETASDGAPAGCQDHHTDT